MPNEIIRQKDAHAPKHYKYLQYICHGDPTDTVTHSVIVTDIVIDSQPIDNSKEYIANPHRGSHTLISNTVTTWYVLGRRFAEGRIAPTHPIVVSANALFLSWIDEIFGLNPDNGKRFGPNGINAYLVDTSMADLIITGDFALMLDCVAPYRSKNIEAVSKIVEFFISISPEDCRPSYQSRFASMKAVGVLTCGELAHLLAEVYNSVMCQRRADDTSY